VVRPASAADVSATLRWASSAGLAVIPYGAGSGVVGGAVPRRSAISIDLRGLAGPPEFDDEAGEVTVDAGVLAGDLERQLNARGRRLAHYPQSLHLATVGGLVATRSSGTFSSKYGNIEDLLVGLEVVLADGTVVATKASPRAATGPSLAQLFAGSEGTLGVLTRVTLRTFPLPEHVAFRGAAFAGHGDGRGDGLGAALTAVRVLLDRGIRPAVIRLYDPVEAAHLFERAGLAGKERSLLILGFDGAAPVVEAEQSVALAEVVAHGGQDLGAGIGETWERTRFDASWLDRGNAGATRLADAIEVSAPWPRLLGLYEQMLAAVKPYTDSSYAHYSHFYPNGGALYLIFTTSAGDTATAVDRYLAAWAAAVKAVHDAGGAMSHHHGVGEARREWMNDELGGSEAILAALKRALDPGNILNPGKLGLTLETSRQEAR
jgi:alkyldihydroxyacetonephosphate synthase